MIASLIPKLLPIVGEVLDRVVPDKAAADKAKLEMETRLLDAVTAQNLAQSETNKVEAEHRSVWVAGWRPAIGWVCAIGLAWNFLGYQLVVWALVAMGRQDIIIPPLLGDNLMELTFAMLGMAGLRTYEKFKGVTK
jgi:hypothetical protein